MSNRAIEKSFMGFLVLEFDINEHGIICHNQSSSFGFTWRQAEIEENTLSEYEIRRKGKGSWRARKAELFREYLAHYEKIELTKSNITAFVITNYLPSDYVITKREYCKKLLISYIEDKQGHWQRVEL